MLVRLLSIKHRIPVLRKKLRRAQHCWLLYHILEHHFVFRIRWVRLVTLETELRWRLGRNKTRVHSWVLEIEFDCSLISIRWARLNSKQCVAFKEVLLKSEPDSALILDLLQTEDFRYPANQPADLKSRGLVLQLVETSDSISLMSYFL